jgi:hypothetical protein
VITIDRNAQVRRGRVDRIESNVNPWTASLHEVPDVDPRDPSPTYP